MALKFLSNITLEQGELQNAKLHPLGTAPSGAEGQVYYDSTNNRLMMHNGTAWYSVNGSVESISSGTSNQITVSGGTGATPSVSAVTAAVINGGTALATGDQIYDFVIAQGYLTDADAVTSLIAGTGISVSGATGDVTVTNTDRGSSQNIFKTIAVSGESSIVADSNTDTLTFSEGSNVTITTDAATDTLTISATDTNTTYTAGSGLDLTGTVFSHEDTSSVTDLTPSSRTYVTGLTFDTYGHVQTVSTGTETVTDTNTTYSVSVPASSTKVRLTGSDSSTDDITFSGTANEVDVTRISADELRIGLPNDVTIGNDLTVTGDLVVNGTTTTVNSNTVNIGDNMILLNSDETGAPSQDAGIEIERGTSANVSLYWNETTDSWYLNDGTAKEIATVDDLGAYNPTIGTDSDYTQSGVNILKSLTLTDGVITNFTSGDMQSSSTTQKGVVELATNTETNTGTDSSRAVTPAGLEYTANQNGGWANDNRAKVLIGNGTDTSLTATHNLGEADVMVQVVEVATGDTVMVETAARSTNSIDVIFASAPASNAFAVYCTRME